MLEIPAADHWLARLRAHWGLRAAVRAARGCLVALFISFCCANIFCARASAQVELPASNLSERIIVAADGGSHWTEGVYDVYLLKGNCYINQGLTYARSREAVLWIERGGLGGEPPHKVIAFLEGDVEINYQQTDAKGKAAGGATLKDKSWFGRFYSTMPVDVRPMKLSPAPTARPPVFEHAMAARNPGAPVNAAPASGVVQASATTPAVKPAQFAEPIAAPPPIVGPPIGMLRVRIQRRSDVRPEGEIIQNPQTNESILMIKQGVNIVVDGVDNFGSIDVDTDNLVIWSDTPLNSDGESVQSPNQRLEIYMEGNVVFRQGERTIYANQMYYDVRRNVGIVLAAEMLTPVPAYEGLLKLRADVVQQIGPDRFVAQNASLTSSRFGVPGYELRAGSMTYEDIQHPVVNPITGQPAVDALGEPVVEHQKMAKAHNNVVYVETLPVFYWPILATDLEKPNYFIDSIKLKNDQVFGTQVFVDTDAYQLLGIRNRPAGTKWLLSTDYLSMRGPAAGTTFNYERKDLFGYPTPTSGFIDAWAIKDHGLDNLGLLRRDFIPEKDFRGRILGQHRSQLPEGFQVTGEVGYISDNNFLEQYYEREWDQLKDQTTDLEVKRYIDNTSWSLFASGRLNDFFTETQWLPRGDHFWLGQPLLGDRLTWYEHTSLAYAQFKSARAPLIPQDQLNWAPLPWEAPAATTRSGERLATRQEIDAPFSAGVFKFDPYAIGELARWGEALDFDPVNRAYGALGIRATLPMWTVDPTVESELFNVHGIAHKMVWSTDVTYAQSTLNLTELPLYDQIDDNNIEAYRRWFAFTDFGGPAPVPPQFDERFYAVRRGLGNWVSSQSTEIADDLFTARLGLNQRWQTKRGRLGNQRVVDLVTLNTDVTFFPDANRDNFGQTVGLVDYNFRWHVGDRTTVTSDGYFDFFENAPKYATIGMFVSRPPRGLIYYGFRSLNGPITSNVLATSYSYRMSPKWAMTYGSTFDLHDWRNIGNNFTLTRIGESFLFSMNINVDTSKGNVGANFAITPRFLQGRLGTASALPISNAGAFGLE